MKVRGRPGPARAIAVVFGIAGLLAGCSSSHHGSSAASGPLTVSQQSSPLPRSQVLILDQVVTEVAGSTAPTGSSQIGASQANNSQSGLNQLGATRNDQGIVISLPEKVLFDFDKSDLRADAQPVLAKIAQVLAGYPTARIQVRGFTDNKGTDTYNQGLSERRANAVKDALVSQFHVDAGHLSAQGFGKGNPVAANTNADGSDNPAGRAQNRRVEVLILAG